MIEFSLRELEAFIAVAEELNFTRAAARLRLAQPPVSRHIRLLESRLGIRLFDRTHRGASLTAAGRAFYAEVQDSLIRLQRAAAAAQRAAAGEMVALDIGFVSSLLGPELAHGFRRFRMAHRQVRLTLHDRVPAEQLREIAAGRLDGGFIGLAPNQQVDGIVFVPWRREAVTLFVPRDHRWARRRCVGRSELKGEPMIAIAADAAPAFASKIKSICRSAGFVPRVIQEARRAQAVLAMVAAGSGAAILPTSVGRMAADSVAELTIDSDEAVVTYVFARRKQTGSDERGRLLDALVASGQ